MNMKNLLFAILNCRRKSRDVLCVIRARVVHELILYCRTIKWGVKEYEKEDRATLPQGFLLTPNEYVASMMTNKKSPRYNELYVLAKRNYKKWYQQNTDKFADDLRIGK